MAHPLPLYPVDLSVNPDWLRVKANRNILEYVDINAGEKRMMMMWNSFVQRNPIRGDCQMESACKRFVEEHGVELLRGGLRSNFMLHLTSLFDFGLLTSGQVRGVVCMLDGVQEECDEPERKRVKGSGEKVDVTRVGVDSRVCKDICDMEGWILEKLEVWGVGVGEDLGEAQNLLDEVKHLETELESREPAIRKILEEASKLVGISTYGVQDIEGRLKGFRKSWSELKRMCSERKEKLEKNVVLYELLAKVESEEAWVTESLKISVVDGVGVRMEDVGGVLKRHDAFNKDLRVHLESLHGIKGLVGSLNHNRQIRERVGVLQKNMDELLTHANKRKKLTRLHLKWKADLAEKWIAEKEVHVRCEEGDVDTMVKEQEALDAELEAFESDVISGMRVLQGQLKDGEIKRRFEDLVGRWGCLVESCEGRRSRMRDGCGVSSESEGKLGGELRLGAPGNVRMTFNVQFRGLGVKWEPVPGADEYVIQVSMVEIIPCGVQVEVESYFGPLVQSDEAKLQDLTCLPPLPPLRYKDLYVVPRPGQEKRTLEDIQRDKDLERIRRLRKDVDGLRGWIYERLEGLRDETLEGVAEIQSGIRKYEAFEAEVNANHKKIELLGNTGEEMKKKLDYAPLVVNMLLDELNRLWDHLISRMNEKRLKLSQALALAQFLESCNESLAWILEKVTVVTGGEFGTDLGELEVLVGRFDGLGNEMVGVECKVVEVIARGDELVGDGHPESEVIRVKKEELHDNWNGLKLLVGERRNELVAAFEFAKFKKRVEKLIERIDGNYLVLLSDDYGDDLGSVRELIREHEGVEGDVAGLRDEVSDLRVEADRVCRVCGRYAEEIRFKVVGVVEDWGRVVEMAKSRKSKLDDNYSYHKFNSEYSDLHNWMSDMKRKIISAKYMGCTASQVTVLLEAYMEYREEIDGKDDEFKLINESGRLLVEQGHFASGEVSERLARLNEFKGRLMGLWNQKKRLFELFGEHLLVVKGVNEAERLVSDIGTGGLESGTLDSPEKTSRKSKSEQPNLPQ